MNRAILGALLVVASLLGWMVYRSESDRAEKVARQRMIENESTAVVALRQAAVAIFLQLEKGIAPSSLARVPGADEFIKKASIAGYQMRCEAETRWKKYELHVDPLLPEMAGARHFMTDETGVIRQQYGSPAERGSEPLR